MSRSVVKQSYRSTRKSNRLLSRAFSSTLESLETRRLLSAGDPDLTFGGTGWVDQTVNGGGFGHAVAVEQATGNVYVAGEDGAGHLAVAKFLHNGSPDASFGDNGVFTTSIADTDVANDIYLSGGSVYVAGTFTINADSNDGLFVMKLNSAGQLDGTFGSGIVLVDRPGSQTGMEMTVDTADNSVLVAGVSNGDSMVVRLTQLGQLDPLFGIGGISVNNLGDLSDINSIGLLHDRSIIIGGNVGGVGALAKLSNLGDIDSSFGQNGVAFSEVDPFGTISGITIGADDSIYAVGTSSFTPPDFSLIVRKYQPVGQLDSNFDTDGEASFDLHTPGLNLIGGGVALDGSGHVVVSGTYADFNSGEIKAAVARFDRNSGAVDSSFGVQGLATTAADGQADSSEVAIDADGNIVSGGSSSDGLLAARFVGAGVVVPPSPVHVDVNGNLIVPGTTGNDVFIITAAPGGAHVIYNAIDAGNFVFTGTINVNGGNGNDTITIDAGVTANASITGGAGNDTISGGSGNDTINGGNDNDSISGGAGADSINGAAGNDTLSGGAGNDTLRGAAGADMMDGGDNDDDIAGGADNDTAIGGNGNDSIANDGGDDQLLGGAGDDTLRCGGGADVAHGEAGNDSILGGIGDDSLYGDGDNDIINGGAGNDFIDGGTGNDDLNGGAGSDIVVGGDGDDLVQGASERDLLIGGLGRDSVIGNADDDILIGGSTTHDNDPASLQSALATWNSGASYSSRVSTLSSTIFIPDVSVHDDAAVDTLTGGAGTDWFIFNGDPGITKDIIDLKSGETATDVD